MNANSHSQVKWEEKLWLRIRHWQLVPLEKGTLYGDRICLNQKRRRLCNWKASSSSFPGCLFSVVFNSLTQENHGIVESKKKRELYMHLLESATDYIKIMRRSCLISLFNVKYRLQRKLNYTSIPSAFNLAKKAELIAKTPKFGYVSGRSWSTVEYFGGQSRSVVWGQLTYRSSHG